MPSRILIATLTLQLVTFAVLAGDREGNYAIWGVGRSSCYQFVKSAQGDPDDRYKVFLMGYLTAFNTIRDDTYNVTGTRSLDLSIAWLLDYCESHQMDSFDRAIQQMIDDSYDSRQRVPPGRGRGWGRPTTEPKPEQKTPQ
jgi:hypothetical protein